MRKSIFILFLLVVALLTQASPRIVYTINDGWRFQKGSPFEAWKENFDDSAWEKVNLPHTWNNLDTDDETPGYYRGPAWYRRHVFISPQQKDKRVFLYFEGANQETEVYLNGQYVGRHKGGYTRFCFDITPWVHFGEPNLFSVKVDNSHNPNIPPLSADFTFYGGIYRDVYLQYTEPLHFATNPYATNGVYIRTPQVSRQEAIVEITAHVTNELSQKQEVRLENSICDATGKEIHKTHTTFTLPAHTTLQEVHKKIKITSPQLWDIDSPYRYQVYTRLFASGKLLDEVCNPLGLRWFKFDPEEGFFLNGKHRKLIGTCRHQDYLQKGNALRDEMHVRDILLLKQMGGNFLRVSHYPQDPVIMEMCDKLGIVTSVEIPVVNAVTETQEFEDNAVHMAREMVYQDFNRPCVLIWGYMNEILLRPPYKDPERLTIYYKNTEKTARALENAIRQADPSRYTMMAYHNAPQAYEAAHLTEIPMIQGWNLYQGWYEPDINEFQRLLDRAHAAYPDKALLVTEYGPGVDPRLHSFQPERFDFTQEYGLIYHQHYLKEIQKRPFVSGSSLWNLNDFYSESRIDAVPHVNNKGVTGLGRERKDTYLFYQAALHTPAQVCIGNREWKTRGGVAHTLENICVQPVPVFSNLPKVELFLNGQSLGKKNCEGYIAQFQVPFTEGENLLEAVGYQQGKAVRDQLRLSFQLIPSDLKNSTVPFTEMNVLLGSQRYFEDREAEAIWIPEQPYRPGSWGYIGGEAYRRKTNFGSMPGSDTDIHGTNHNPIFQTQRVGIEGFKADVPDGVYSIYFYWAELDSDKQKEALAYNLGADATPTSFQERVFGLSINGVPVLENLNLARDYGFGQAVIQKFIVQVQQGEGINIKFNKQKGEPVLNALRIYKNN